MKWPETYARRFALAMAFMGAVGLVAVVVWALITGVSVADALLTTYVPILLACLIPAAFQSWFGKPGSSFFAPMWRQDAEKR